MTLAQSILAEWSPPIGLTLATGIAGWVYWRGWRAIRRTRAERFGAAQLACFWSGLAILWLAVCSPLDGFADTSLTAHMFQHFLLMAAAPPLLLLGTPVVPLLRGLPRWMRRGVAGPLLRQRWLRALAHALSHPTAAWLLFNGAFLLWHLPGPYDFALQNERVHDLEHLCFLATAMLFWYVVLQPWPAAQRTNGWMVLLYLLSADIVNTALSAFLVFCGRPVYGFYITASNPFGLSPLADQMAAGALMWVLNSTVFLIPAMVLTARLAGLSAPARRRIGLGSSI